MTHRGRDRPGEMWRNGLEGIPGQKLGKRRVSLAEHPGLLAGRQPVGGIWADFGLRLQPLF